jgi:hypothetical protein
MECPAPASDHTTAATTSDFNLRNFQHLFSRIFSYVGITKEESETTEFFFKKKNKRRHKKLRKQICYLTRL